MVKAIQIVQEELKQQDINLVVENQTHLGIVQEEVVVGMEAVLVIAEEAGELEVVEVQDLFTIHPQHQTILVDAN